MKNLKTIVLKTLFFTISAIIGIYLIGCLSFLISSRKGDTFVDYITSFTKFFFEFAISSILIGITLLGFMYLANKIYKKFFDK